MKNRALLLSLLVLVSSIAVSQNVMTSAPQGSVVKGRLIGNVDGKYTEVITVGYIFALSADKKQVLGYTIPAKGTLTTGGGAWELTGLPMNGRVLFVGYAAKVHRLCWMQEVNLDGRKYYNLGDNTAYMALPSTSPGEAIGSVLNALYLVGWFVEVYQQGKYYAQVDQLTAELDKYKDTHPAGIPKTSQTACDPYKLTTKTYSCTSDFNQACTDEFGADYEIADWGGFKSFLSGNVQNWVACKGKYYKPNGWIEYSGESYVSGTNKRYLVYYNNDKMTFPRLHDQIINIDGTGNDLVLVSDNYSTIPVICKCKTK